MPTRPISEDLRTRIVVFYRDNPDATYDSTANRFMVGRATVDRILRLHRETGSVTPQPKERKRNFKVNQEWLEKHVADYPDARLRDRVAAFEASTGKSISIAAMHNAMKGYGYTYKKNSLC